MTALSGTLEFSRHPAALRGHFPDNPIIPAVALLDEVLQRATRAAGELSAPSAVRWQIGHAKFHRPLRPGEPLAFELERQPDGSVRFTLSCAGTRVAQGVLLPGGDEGSS